MINLPQPTPDAVSVPAIVQIVISSIPYVLLYFIIGFGPGFILGILIANFVSGRGQPTYMDTHRDNAKRAATHNAQWNPKHERWKKS